MLLPQIARACSALVTLVLTSACGPGQAPTESPGFGGTLTQPASEVGLAEIWGARTLRGHALQKDDRAVTLVIFASWCGPCRHELRLLGELRSRYPRMRMIGINAYEEFRKHSSPEKLRVFLDASAPWLDDVVSADSDLLKRFGSVPKIPTLFVYDSRGKIIEEFRRNRRVPPSATELSAAFEASESL